MSFNFDLYVPRPSWLHRVDPRVKLVFVVLGTVALLVFIDVSTSSITRWRVYCEWKHRPNKWLHKIALYLPTKKERKHRTYHMFKWIFDMQPFSTIEKKPLIASIIPLPLILFISSDILVIVLASLIGGIIGYFISCKQRRQIISASIIPVFLLTGYSVLKTSWFVLSVTPELMEALTIILGIVALYLIIIALFIPVLCGMTWLIARSFRNLKEHKHPMLLLEGRCDL